MKDCPRCKKTCIQYGKYWLCNNCKEFYYNGWLHELRSTWFIFLRYGISAFTLGALTIVFLTATFFTTILFIIAMCMFAIAVGVIAKK